MRPDKKGLMINLDEKNYRISKGGLVISPFTPSPPLPYPPPERNQ